MVLDNFINYRADTTTQLFRARCPESTMQHPTYFAVKMTRDREFGYIANRGYLSGGTCERTVREAIPDGRGAVHQHMWCDYVFQCSSKDMVHVQVFNWLPYPTLGEFCQRRNEEATAAKEEMIREKTPDAAARYLILVTETDHSLHNGVVNKVLRIMGAVHERGINHGDLSACNILVAEDSSRVVLIDWANSTGPCNLGQCTPKVGHMDYELGMHYMLREHARDQLARLNALPTEEAKRASEDIRSKMSFRLRRRGEENVESTLDLSGGRETALPAPSMPKFKQDEEVTCWQKVFNFAQNYIKKRSPVSLDIYGLAITIVQVHTGCLIPEVSVHQLESIYAEIFASVPKDSTMALFQQWMYGAQRFKNFMNMWLGANQICDLELVGKDGSRTTTSRHRRWGVRTHGALCKMIGGTTVAVLETGYEEPKIAKNSGA